MKITIIGTGYVGLVAGTCFAETGNDVICVDIDEAKIQQLQKGNVPIYEPGLEEMLRRNAREDRLRFSTDLAAAVGGSLLIFIAVGTPRDAEGRSDLRFVLEAARGIARSMDGYRIIVNKSTVPVGTADRVREEISGLTAFEFDVVSNPEFLKEGAAIDDFMKPDRVIIGTQQERAGEVMRELYAPFTRTGAPILITDCRSAEMTKYAANAMLASRISFMNEMANLCEHVGADIHWVRQGIALDRRIGPSFLFPGLGYGGSCFPKDIRALIQLSRDRCCPLPLVHAVEQVNEFQKLIMVQKIVKFYSSEIPGKLEELRRNHSAPEAWDLRDLTLPDLKIYREIDASVDSAVDRAPAGLLNDKTFALWGLSFKPQTNDMREAPSIRIIQELLRLGAKIQAYDPVAMDESRRLFGEAIQYARTNYEALRNADALVLITEWNLFRNPDFSKVRSLMRFPVIFDGRNQYNPEEMDELGFLYFAIGRR